MLVIGFISVLFFLGYQLNELGVGENGELFEIAGLYGDEWKVEGLLSKD